MNHLVSSRDTTFLGTRRFPVSFFCRSIPVRSDRALNPVLGELCPEHRPSRHRWGGGCLIGLPFRKQVSGGEISRGCPARKGRGIRIRGHVAANRAKRTPPGRPVPNTVRPHPHLLI